MPSRGIDFGSNLHNFIMYDDDMVHNSVPGAWLGHSGDEEDEEFSDANMTGSRAKSIADSALADLQRATSEADTARLRRQALRKRYAADEWRLLGNFTPKDSKALTSSNKSSSIAPTQSSVFDPASSATRRSLIDPSPHSTASPSNFSTAAAVQSNASSVPTNKVRRFVIDPSLKSGASPNKPDHAAPAQGNASNTPANAPRRPILDSSLNSGERKAGRARAHDRGFLSLMDDFNTRGGAHTAATRRLVDGGLFSEDQIAAAARAKLRADARAGNGEVSQEDRLAALRAKLANKGEVVATVSRRASDSGVEATKLASQASVRPESSQASVSLGAPNLPAQHKIKILFSADTTQPGLSTADKVKQPVGNTSANRQLLANESKPEIEAGRRRVGSSAPRTLPVHDLGQASKPCSSTKPAAAAASTADPTPSQSVSEKVQAILRRYGDVMKICDDASAAAFVAHKLKEDADRIKFDAGKPSFTPAQLKTPATPKAKNTTVATTKPNVAKTAAVDNGFDVLTSEGPSSANGSPLPDPDLIKDQLDMEFSPTLKGFQGWEDDYDSDDSEEWDLGGLAEWKWVGEKSAKKNSAAKRQA